MRYSPYPSSRAFSMAVLPSSFSATSTVSRAPSGSAPAAVSFTVTSSVSTVRAAASFCRPSDVEESREPSSFWPGVSLAPSFVGVDPLSDVFSGSFSGGVGSVVFSLTSPSKPSMASAASANTETFRNESAISRESATATIFPSRQLRASASRCIVFISTNFSLTLAAFSPPCILTFRAVSAIPKTPAIRVMQSGFNIDENSTQL